MWYYEKRNRKDKIFMVLDRENKFIGFLEGSDKNSVKTRLKELKTNMRRFQDITFMYLIIEWRGGQIEAKACCDKAQNKSKGSSRTGSANRTDIKKK